MRYQEKFLNPVAAEMALSVCKSLQSD